MSSVVNELLPLSFEVSQIGQLTNPCVETGRDLLEFTCDVLALIENSPMRVARLQVELFGFLRGEMRD